VLICLASKNDERDVWAVFDRRDMVLRRKDLAAYSIGWHRKSEGIQRIAEELTLGIDSFVFIDDNPAEIAEVASVLPEVRGVVFPNDPVEWMSAIVMAGLDRLPPTEDDINRATFYAQDRERKDTRTSAASPEEYLAGLGIEITVFKPASSDLPRFAQLIAKTNQFNLNGRRRVEAELATIAGSPRHVTRLFSAVDKFGDYGTVGAIIVDCANEGAVLDTFLMSCRVMGRGIEEAMVATALEANADLTATLLELPRNEPARRFFGKLGCAPGQPGRLTRIAWPAHIRRHANE
jgi:FkbH-like protein